MASESVQVSMPSRVILAGEDAVVFGATSVACAVNLMNTCTLRAWSRPFLRLRLGRQTVDAEPGHCVETYERMAALCETRSYDRIWTVLGSEPLVWVVSVLGQLLGREGSVPHFEARLHLAHPLGSGLGGSSAVTALVAAGAARLGGTPLPASEICELAFAGDRIAHGGDASRTDSAAIVHGGFIAHQPGKGHWPLDVTAPLRLLLCYSGRRKRTSESLARFRLLSRERPAEFRSHIAEFDRISRALADTLEGTRDMSAIGALFNRNQDLLRAMGVSTPEIDEITRTALELGAVGAKLTGGGGGGYVIVLASDDALGRISTTLAKAGREVIRVRTFEGVNGND